MQVADTATEGQTLDMSGLPDTAFPDGMDGQSYLDSLKTTPTDKTAPIQSEAQAKTDVPTRPDDVQEKFWDAEKGAVNTDALLKSYRELEQRLRNPDKPKGLTIDKPGEADAAQATEEAKADTGSASFVEAASKLMESYSGGGQFGADERTAMLNMGLPETMIASIEEGQRAKEELAELRAFEVAGGKDTYFEMLDWAADALSDEEQAAFNTSVVNGQTSRQAIEWLTQRYKAGNPSEGRFVQTQSTSSSGDVFRSEAEKAAAFRDPRYATDDAYRNDVAEKLARTLNQAKRL